MPSSPPVPPDATLEEKQPSNFTVGEYSHETWSIQISEASADDVAELARFTATDLDEDVDGSSDDDIFNELDDDLAAFLDETASDPSAHRQARGTPLWVGLDAEWVYDEATQSNHILSIQLYVPDQAAISTDPRKQANVRKLSRVVYASSPTREGRPSLQANLRRLVDEALEHQLIADAPRIVYVVGFGLRFDLAALGDFPELKHQIDSVSGKVATVGAHAKMEYARNLIAGDIQSPLVIGLRFIDIAAHVAVGTALRDIGKLIGNPKLDIPKPFSIERMDEYLRADRAGFEAYAMRDAEIAVLYALRLAAFAAKELGFDSLPATASGLALKWCLKTLSEAKIDRLQAFGLCQTTTEAFHASSKKRRTIREVGPTPMRRIQEAFLTDCYAGGRNEAYAIGPSPVGIWRDYDLAGAYSTGLVDLPLIDFENPRPSLDVEDYLGHVAGFALVEFEHREDTRFPVFAVSRGGKGLIFPRKGIAYATAPEIRAAHDLDCTIKIKWGVIYPWRWLPGDDGENGVPKTRLFGPFIKAARQLRNKLKQEAQGKDSLEEQAAKLYANSVYGKICQSLRPKNVFDTRKVSSVSLKPSPITNPAIGAHVTGFIRAILAEILNRIPRHRHVLSCTTDGFLTDATDVEMSACLTGPLCRRFQALCDEIVPGSRMLEIKHEVAQVVCMKTRGQLTGKPLPGKKIVLAKAGVQVVVEAAGNLDGEAYKALQNDKMLNLYLDRRPGKKIVSYRFPALRDQWEKGIDLHKFESRLLLSLEPDLKRAPCNPRMVNVASRQRAHVFMDTRPWNTVEEFDSARACLDEWRRTNCLKTLADWQSLGDAIRYNLARARLRVAGRKAMNLRKVERPLVDALRRAFLRAYAREQLGIVKTFSYPALARWLTEAGYPTKESEPRSAQAQELVLNSMPRTDEVMSLWRLLQVQFPEADLEPLLADTDSLGYADDTLGRTRSSG